MTIELAIAPPAIRPAAAQAAQAGSAARVLRGWRPCLLILLGWQVLALLEALATTADASHNGRTLALAPLLAGLALQYLPLVLNSWVLALLFHRRQDSMLRPSRLLLAFFVSMAVFLPLLTGVDLLIVLLRDGRPWRDFPAMLTQLGHMTWWYNIFVVSLAFLAQAAYSAWRRGRQQAWSAQRAHTENLQLRLGLLQGQLKPHFLFNALNSISALVRTADAALADRALQRLGELLHYAQAAGQGRPASVDDELGFLRTYLALQSLRYGDRMHVDWTVEARDWRRYPCPPLLFQPLAENAVHHGVEPHQLECRIDIALACADGMVCLRITNPVLAGARAGHGLGLTMTRERLAILYGQRADLHIDADEHHYTIELRFPADGQQAA
ncbi:sensor histidine kinase [Duganella sp. HH101]|uniref:sensor histidine kinase n=1 Tax=Duganella sp. HH101 TaxID=1781066 RepID=UPI0008756A7A|nr:histidine kinase [Duganella sp. HH101]OFA00544.1 putative sensor-like histidine kinase [Duganella sp. HH101]